jgi:hypothetical protein
MDANPCAPTSDLLKDTQAAYQRLSVSISGWVSRTADEHSWTLIPVLQPAIYSKTPRLFISVYQCPSVVGFSEPLMNTHGR